MNFQYQLIASHKASILTISFAFSIRPVTIGIASETLNDWADEEAGLEAVQRVLDSLDDIHALQDEYVDDDVLRDMLTDNRLCALLQVIHPKYTLKVTKKKTIQ